MASSDDQRGKRQRPARAALMIGGKPYVGRTHAATGYVSSWVRRSSDLLCYIDVILRTGVVVTRNTGHNNPEVSSV